MKNILITCILLVCFISVKAQRQADTIQIEKKFNTNYLLLGEKLTPKQLLTIMEVNPTAYDLMKKAKRNYDASQIIAGVGGFMIGFPIGTAIAGGDPNWLLAGIGVGLVGVAIPFSINYNKKARAAVALYNDGIRSLGSHKIEMKFALNAKGIGLTLNF